MREPSLAETRVLAIIQSTNLGVTRRQLVNVLNLSGGAVGNHLAALKGKGLAANRDRKWYPIREGTK